MFSFCSSMGFACVQQVCWVSVMAKMISEIVDSLGSETPSGQQLATKTDIRKLARDLLVIKWMLGLVTLAVLFPLIKPFFA